MSKFESSPQPGNPDSESIEVHIEAGRKTAELVSGIYDDLPPQLRQNLVNSNIVLTLAGEKGLTFEPVEISGDEDVQTIQGGVQRLQEYFEQRRPEVRTVVGSGIRQKRDGSRYVALIVENLRGYERATSETRIPGVPKFDAAKGYNGLADWGQDCLAGLEEAKKQGKIPTDIDSEIIYQGISSGYPDVAVIDFARSIDSEQPYALEEVPIKYAGTYKEAVPIYDVKPEHLSKPGIVKHSERWSNVLTGFYESDWHKKVAPELSSHRRESHE